MSTAHVLILGAIAGFTIFLGLPVGRLRGLSAKVRAFLSAIAAGVLLFLLWDTLSHASEPIESAITDGERTRLIGLTAAFIVGTAVGLLSLVYYEKWMARRRSRSLLRPGAASIEEMERKAGLHLSPAANLSLLIAIGIGLHNFSEGLAIGQSAAGGELALAYALIIGFGLHNATEGFGIVGPLAGETQRPGWGFLAALGVIGGGPTFLGTAVGQVWVNDYVSCAFLALAAGSILFVILELVRVNSIPGMKHLVSWGLMAGLFAGFATDWVLIGVGA
ncbi:MAG: zinc permease [Dehalococcoidia bacterium]|nr:zinc permease [Dehalococcoidia bacterium]